MPILVNLGWSYSLEETKIISGVSQKLDAILFATNSGYKAYKAIKINERRYIWSGIDIILEAKKSDVTLDTGKVSKSDNPYIQALSYLQTSRISWGFLTNGRQWYLIDNSAVSGDKKFLRFFLDKILKEEDKESFELFWRIFHANNYAPMDQLDTPPISLLSEQDQKRRREIETDLKAVIYGTEGQLSLFEETGRAIFQSVKNDPNPPGLDEIFRNSLYFVYRLFFIAYLEDHYRNLLTENSEYDYYFSLWKLRAEIEDMPDNSSGWGRLQLLFAALNSGNSNFKIPLLDGGLFDLAKAPLLNQDNLFSNSLLSLIFKRLFRDSRGELLDFSVFSPSHLGTIYEGLLEFQFRVADEELDYAVVASKKEKIEGYFDTLEIKKYKKDKEVKKISFGRNVAKGELYLVNSNNNRKYSGSYYTPDSLAYPLVARGIEQQLAGPFRDRSILDMRILDCACGSGHLLLVALNILADKAMDRLAADHNLNEALASELRAIRANLERYKIDSSKVELDEISVLKRILLKKIIYGVDQSPFAVELTQLGLWLDTFIFGTPLSFIEHHIKCGNSLIGTDIQTLVPAETTPDIFDNPLFKKLTANRKEIEEKMAHLCILNDTNEEQINESKSLYNNDMVPLIQYNNERFNYLNYLDFLSIEGRKLPELRDLLNPNNDCESRDEDLAPFRVEMEKYREKFGFFNWENEFPEVFSSQNCGGPGFHVLIGNPPWDKTKFEEPMFFAQYRSNYRTMTNSQKKDMASALLDKPEIKEKFEREKELVYLTNEYLKRKYPFNRGAGDGNLFRFFAERGLLLLAEGGSLNYILPTGLLTEDGSTDLRKHILENYSLSAFDGFENRKRLFPDVHASYKFGLIQIQNVQNPDQAAKMRFLLTDPEKMDDERNSFPYPLTDVKSTSPKHWAYMEVAGGARDLEIIKRLYAKFPALEESWLDFRNELHATNDKKIFREQEDPGYLPLYKGEMIWQYQASASEPSYWLDPAELDGYLLSTRINRLISDIKDQFSGGISRQSEIPDDGNLGKWLTSFLNVPKAGLAKFIVPERNFYRLGFRAIASDTNERTLVAALLPPDIGAQNSLWLSIPGHYILDLKKKAVTYQEISLSKLLFCQAIFNSLTADWLLRASVAMNVNKTYLYRLPVPQPSDRELAENESFKAIIRNSALLSLYKAPEILAEIKTDLKIKDSELIKTDQTFERKKAALDLSVAGLYELDGQDLKHIAASFKVLNNKNPYFIQHVLNSAG
ncbi:MAG: restriction endonuclease [Deltaproteobacteria bacterium]|nr:restriction endonuclease [Deltaproteobacteria bacterium]